VTTSAEDQAVPGWPGGPAPVSAGWAAALAGEGAPRVIRIYRDGTGRVQRAAAAARTDRLAVMKHSSSLRSAARDYLPRSHDDGLDVRRVDRFLAARGLSAPPAVLLTKPEVAAFRDTLLDRFGWSTRSLDLMASPSSGQTWTAGGYEASLGLVVMIRDYAMERLNGPGYTEALLVHEKAHGNDVDNNVMCEKEDGQFSYFHNRTGFSCAEQGPSTGAPTQGSFLEEGFADYLAGEYSTSQLGRWYGPWPYGDRPPLDAPLDQVPDQYFWRDAYHPGCLAFGFGVLAASGLKLLMDRDPRLWPALVSARTSVKGLRDVARIVESADTGLYDRLRRLDYNTDDFAAGFTTIQALPPRSLAVGSTPSWSNARRERLTMRQLETGLSLPEAVRTARTASARQGPLRPGTGHGHSTAASPGREQPARGRPPTRKTRSARGSGTAQGRGAD
jgi:hypothetical protein